MATISIGRSSSQCLACKKGASPSDNGHERILAYGPESGNPGCGEPWTAVRIDYSPLFTGFVFENLRGLPMEGFLIEPGATYPPKELFYCGFCGENDEHRTEDCVEYGTNESPYGY